jgi:hypothetical protein
MKNTIITPRSTLSGRRIPAPFARARSAVVALAGGLAVLLSAHQSVSAAGVVVGSSTLIGTLDYSDTWTVGAGATVTARQSYVPGSFPPSAGVLAVENTYGNLSRTWDVPGSLVTDTAGIVPGTPTFPGGSGAGSATGFTQAGLPSSGLAFGMAYDIRSKYVVQWDAVQTADWVGVVTGGNTITFGAINNLLVYFKPTGSGDASIHLFSSGIGDKTTGFTTSVTTGSWNNYAVEFDLPNKSLSFYTNQNLLGHVDLTTFDGGSFSNLAGLATTNDRIGLAVSGAGANRLWTDNFQVGVPEPSTSALLGGFGVLALLRRRRIC